MRDAEEGSTMRDALGVLVILYKLEHREARPMQTRPQESKH